MERRRNGILIHLEGPGYGFHQCTGVLHNLRHNRFLNSRFGHLFGKVGCHALNQQIL